MNAITSSSTKAELTSPLRVGVFVGKLMLTLPFIVSGLAKLGDFASAVAEMQHFALPCPAMLARLVIILQLGASILILMGRIVWVTALSLASFTIAATLVAHAYWLKPAAEQLLHRNIFFDHGAIVGGLLLLAAWDLRGKRS